MLEKPLRPRELKGLHSGPLFIGSQDDSLWSSASFQPGHNLCQNWSVRVALLHLGCGSGKCFTRAAEDNCLKLAALGSCCSCLFPSALFKSSWEDPEVPHSLTGVAKGHFTPEMVQSRFTRSF